MFGIGSTELLVILLVALIVLGPKSLASVSRSLGKAMGEFRRVSTDFQRTLNAEAARDDARQEAEKRRQQAAQDAREREERAKTAAAEPSGGGRAESDAVSLAKNSSAPVAAEKGAADSCRPPEGSPVAEAVARSRAEAEKGGAGNA